MGAQPCTSKVKNDTKQNDKAFEEKKKKKKKQVGSPYDLFMIII